MEALKRLRIDGHTNEQACSKYLVYVRKLKLEGTKAIRNVLKKLVVKTSTWKLKVGKSKGKIRGVLKGQSFCVQKSIF